MVKLRPTVYGQEIQDILEEVILTSTAAERRQHDPRARVLGEVVDGLVASSEA
jgi:hypothetical protein